MKVTLQSLPVHLPDFLIVGAAKSGTTSLYYYLNRHPSIFMPEIKEPWFFSFKDHPPAYSSPEPLHHVVWKLEDYIRLFAPAHESQWLGEASPSYLYTSDTTIRNIRDVYGDVWQKLKIIIILRPPSERAWSQYLHFHKWFMEPLPFPEAIDPGIIRQRMDEGWNIFYDYRGFGEYDRQVRAFIDSFPHVRIYLYEELRQDALAVVRDILQFLEIPGAADYSPSNISQIFNKSGTARNPFMAAVFKGVIHNPLSRYLVKTLGSESKRRIRSILDSLFLKRQHIDPAIKRELDAYFAPHNRALKELVQKREELWRNWAME